MTNEDSFRKSDQVIRRDFDGRLFRLRKSLWQVLGISFLACVVLFFAGIVPAGIAAFTFA